MPMISVPPYERKATTKHVKMPAIPLTKGASPYVHVAKPRFLRATVAMPTTMKTTTASTFARLSQNSISPKKRTPSTLIAVVRTRITTAQTVDGKCGSQ